MVSASSRVPRVRLSRISRRTFGVQRSAAMLLPARCATASALDSASESMVPPAGSQRAAPGPGLGERVKRSTSWPSATRLATSADPISPVEPVTATSMLEAISSCSLLAGGRPASCVLGTPGPLGIGAAVAGAAQDAARELEPGDTLAERLDDRRPVLGELLADHRVLVLREGVGSRLDGVRLGQAARPCRVALGAASRSRRGGLALTDLLVGLGAGDAGVALGLGQRGPLVGPGVRGLADGRLEPLLLAVRLQFGDLRLLDDDLLAGGRLGQRAALPRLSGRAVDLRLVAGRRPGDEG